MSTATMIPPPTRVGGTEAVAPEPFRASHTDGFPDLLRALGVSLLVTTYQPGKLVVVREQAGRLNTLGGGLYNDGTATLDNTIVAGNFLSGSSYAASPSEISDTAPTGRCRARESKRAPGAVAAPRAAPPRRSRADPRRRSGPGRGVGTSPGLIEARRQGREARRRLDQNEVADVECKGRAAAS